MSSSTGILTREWRRFRDSYDPDAIVEGCRPAGSLVPVAFWVTVILVCRFVPALNRAVGLREILLPIAVTCLAGLASILSWALGRRNADALAALQLVENGFYSAALVSTAAYSQAPASHVICGFFALSCVYWGVAFSFTVMGLAPLVASLVPFLLGWEIDPISVVIMGIGILCYYTMGNITAYRRRHKTHALRSEDVLNRLETVMGSCRSGVVAEMEVKMASLAHRVHTCLHAVADDVKEMGAERGGPGKEGTVVPALENLRRAVSVLDDFLDGLRSGAQAPPSFHLPKIASGVETASPSDEERLEWGPLPDVWVGGQEGMIALSLQSLVDNALEAGAGHVRIDSEAQGGEVAMTISDDGPGLPAQVRNNLFRPYNTFGKSSGVGLGMYLAAQILRAAGGDLELVASSTRGTRFKVTLQEAEPFRAARLDSQRHLKRLELGDG
jgi:hypothetical protein